MALTVGMANSEVEFVFPTSEEVGHPSVEPRRSTRRDGWAWFVVSALAGVAAVGGCGPDAGALIYHLFQPKVDVPAEHTLSDGPLLILVEFSGDPPTTNAARLITDALTEQFREHGVSDRIIPFRRLEEFRRIEADHESMSVHKIGQRVEADRVLWIRITLKPPREVGGNELISGLSCRADVRVVNPAATKRTDVRVWPPGLTGRPGRLVETEISVHKARAAATADARTRLLADRLADKIAKLFYDHVITPDNREPGT